MNFFCVYKALVKYINIILLVVVVVVLLSDIFFVTFRAFHIYIFSISLSHDCKIYRMELHFTQTPEKKSQEENRLAHIKISLLYTWNAEHCTNKQRFFFFILRHIFSFTLYLWYELRRVSSEKNIYKKSKFWSDKKGIFFSSRSSSQSVVRENKKKEEKIRKKRNVCIELCIYIFSRAFGFKRWGHTTQNLRERKREEC